MDAEFLRNVGVVAHIDAGKTTTTERFLYYSGKTHKLGEVHEGTASMDWMEQEQERGITITSAATQCTWKRAEQNYSINIIDTPGHIDFGIEVERSLRVLDGVIVVLCGVAGVQPQTETVWKQTEKFFIPKIIFVNKMDRIGADFSSTIQELKETFCVKLACLNFPMRVADKLIGVIDLLKMKAIFFDEDSLGRNYQIKEIPQSYQKQARQKKEELLDQLSLVDDSILESLIARADTTDVAEFDELISEAQIKKAIRKGTLSQKLLPVFCGSAFKNIGVQFLLDAIVDFLPSPRDIDYKQKGIGGNSILQPDNKLPLTSLVFKTEKDKYSGMLSFLRIYQGELEKGKIYYLNQARKERIDNIYRMHVIKKENITKASAGEIVAVTLNKAYTGDTLAAKGQSILETIKKFQPVVSVAIEPGSAEDLNKLHKVLEFLQIEDPSFQAQIAKETGQILISGMGELHLEVIKEKIIREHKLKIVSGKPQVSYRESISYQVEEEVEIKKTIAKENIYAKCKLCLQQIKGDDLIFEQAVDFEHPQKAEILSKIEAAVRISALSGVVGGHPVIKIKAILTGIEAPEGKLNVSIYAVCASQAFRNCLLKANSFLLSPMMKLQVVCFDDCLGEIIRDLNARKAKVSAIEEHNTERIVCADLPLSFLFGYTTAIRSLSKGRAHYSAEFAYYQKDN